MKKADLVAILKTMRQIEAGEDPSLDCFSCLRKENGALAIMHYGPFLPSLNDATEAIKILKAHIAQFRDAPELIGQINHLFNRARHGEFTRREDKCQPKPKRTGCIYLAVSSSHSRTKIGFSADPDTRLAALRDYDPEINFHFVSEPRFTLADERNLHERFAAHRHHREWFALENAHVEQIKGILAK